MISISSAEAKYRCLACIAAKVAWVQSVLNELHVTIPRIPTIWCDDTSVVALSANPILHSKTKHIKFDYHFMGEKVLKKELMVAYCHVPFELSRKV